ncbi:MAG: DUF1846 domain-containing protein [Defluviitaleaceae bacterium]|nr:DUF1846 domain-containing protein [Defluviitaleaceae bacterium]
MYRIGFDSEAYIKIQTKHIQERIKQFGNKLYLEFGGKLLDDHAARVLPGFEADVRLTLLKSLADIVEIVPVINAENIEQNRFHSSMNESYGDSLLNMINTFRRNGLLVSGVVITHYAEQPLTKAYKTRLEKMEMPVYLHHYIEDYPANITHILSKEGFGKNDYIETTRPLVIVTGPGAASGKMAVCLSQLYRENERGVAAGYAKFELFPTWNLSINHPVNLAYEAATVDLRDVNLIDPFHLDKYGVTAVNYNRDVESFSILNTIFKEIWEQSPYNSPTDMGVNMAGHCIVDDEAVRFAAGQEIIRRYYTTLSLDRVYGGYKTDISKLELLMHKAETNAAERIIVNAALEKEKESGQPSLAIQLPDGRIITGTTKDLLGAASAAMLNTLKTLAGLNDNINLLSPIMIEPIQNLKLGFLGNRNPRLHIDEVLIALSVCSPTNPTSKLVLDQLPKLRNSEAHSTVMLSQADMASFRKLGVNLTCEPRNTVG